MKLTDEQIAEFETRAKAGEKPMDIWDEEPEERGRRGDGWLSMQCSSLVVQSFAEGDAILHLPTLKEVKFSSVPAAQLAAEHLLREATRGLHRLDPSIQMIADERRQQVEEEGFDAKYDAQWEPEALAQAAACYATPGNLRERLGMLRHVWPFTLEWLKPSATPTFPDGRIRDLVKAAALCAAEIDRIRKEKPDEAN